MNSPKRANKFLLFFLLYYLLILFVVPVIVYFLPSMHDSIENYTMIFQDFVLILIPLIIYSIVTKTKPSEYIPHKKLSLKNAVYVILITIFSLPVLLLVANIASLFFSFDANDGLNDIMDNMNIFTALISMAVFPAIFEESLCRGLIMTNYKTTSPVVMYVISGLFFGIVHLNFQQMSYAVVAGILFAFFVHYTNSIFSSILAHFFINGYQVVLGKLLLGAKSITDSAQYSESIDNIPIDNAEMIVSVAFAALIVTAFILIDYKLIKKFIARNKLNAQEYINGESGTNKKFIDGYFIAIIVLFIIISVIMEFFGKLLS